MTVRVRTAAEADRQIDELDRWWRENRTAASTQVPDGLQRIKALLLKQPEIGKRYKRHKNVRWLRVKKTPYKVYYTYDRKTEEVMILSVWSSSHGRGPPLR